MKLPRGVTQEDARSFIQTLAEEEDLIIESVDVSGGETWISLKTQPSLLSWGEKINLRIDDDEIEIESKASSQIIDWGKPDDNVDLVTQRLKSDFGRRSNYV
ncbi:hypothetical protein [Natribaculum luteum]|uniref:hypothetical protein n=1 Tax=Natribaculum luteum TaxID=1586232 RepID=UPI001FF2A305|nr:hypothetical protein [Natribaculum luteum]